MGDTAASGGYYVAMAAHEIVAESTTLTGSIGVVMMSLELEGLLQTLGVRFDSVSRGRHAGIYDPFRARSEEERAHLKAQVRRLYENFVAKAAGDRSLTPEELESAAQGRVWTGAQARTEKLVDVIGGLDTAVARARERAGLASDEGRVVWSRAVSPAMVPQLGFRPLDGILPFLHGAQLLCPIQTPLR